MNLGKLNTGLIGGNSYVDIGTTVQDKPLITHQLQRLNEAIEQLDHTVGQLIGKLSPVTLEIVACKDSGNSAPREQRSMISESIREMTDRILKVDYRLQETFDHIDLP